MFPLKVVLVLHNRRITKWILRKSRPIIVGTIWPNYKLFLSSRECDILYAPNIENHLRAEIIFTRQIPLSEKYQSVKSIQQSKQS